MEIALHDETIEPFVESLSGGSVRVHAHPKCDIEQFLNSQPDLNPLIVDGIRDLWFSPDIERKFDRRGDYVLVTRAD
jgi:hypothetical protein